MRGSDYCGKPTVAHYIDVFLMVLVRRYDVLLGVITHVLHFISRRTLDERSSRDHLVVVSTIEMTEEQLTQLSHQCHRRVSLLMSG